MLYNVCISVVLLHALLEQLCTRVLCLQAACAALSLSQQSSTVFPLRRKTEYSIGANQSLIDWVPPCVPAAAPSWRRACTLSGYHERTVYSVDWSRLHGRIATGAADNCIRVFQEVTSRAAGDSSTDTFELEVLAPGAHRGDVNCVRWCPREASVLVSAGDDGLIKLWRFVPSTL